MKRFILILVTVVFTLFSVVAYGAPQVTVVFNPDDATVSMKGSADGITTVRVTADGTDASTLSDHNLPVDVIQFMSPGSFEETFGMPENIESGKYLLYVTDSKGSYDDSFIYYTSDLAREILQNEVNISENEDEYASAVEENALNLGIDITHPEHSTEALEMMYSLYEGEENPGDFYQNYIFCRAVSSLNGKSRESVEEILKKNELTLGIDYESEYESSLVLTESAKENLCLFLSELDYEKSLEDGSDLTGREDFIAVYGAYCALASAASADSWMELKEIYTESYDFLSDNVVDSNRNYKNSISTSVFTKMVGYDFENISDLKNNFEKAVKSVTEKKTPSSGGGGGGGGGGNTFTAPSETEKEPVYDTVPGQEIQEATSASIPSFSQIATYSDVASDAWYAEPVGYLGGASIINGYVDGTFKPDNLITRAEFTKMIAGAFSLKGGTGEFADVPSDAWYAPYVSVCSAAGIITGFEGIFRPEHNITREDAAVIIYRIANLLEVDYSGYKEPADMNDISIYAWTAVATLYANDVISGVGGGKFEPKTNITRAQAAKLIYSATKDMIERN